MPAGEGLLDGGEADAFLLQADGRAQGAIQQIAVELRFLGIQEIQAGGRRTRLDHPLAAVGQQRCAVHQHRAGVSEPAPQPVEDHEAVGVDVAPVDQVQIGEPGERFEHVHRVTPAEDDDGVARQREGQVGDLVLDHVGALGFRRRRRELAGADGELGEAAESRRAEPNVARLAAEPVPAGEVGRGGVNPVGSELQVEQFSEHASVLLDELGVHAGHVDLPQVYPWRLALVDPPDGGQQLFPQVRELEQLHRPAGQPRDEPRAAPGRRIGE
jgi:hypothetical protein